MGKSRYVKKCPLDKDFTLYEGPKGDDRDFKLELKVPACRATITGTIDIENHSAHIHTLKATPKRRGCGSGLVAKTEEYLACNGVKQVSVVSSDEAKPFWYWVGYEREAPWSDHRVKKLRRKKRKMTCD